jgi:uncharacterized integral membrane protein
MVLYLKWVILIVVLLFFITFGLKNSQPVYTNYYFNIKSLDLPSYAMVFITILVGIFVGMIVGILSGLNLGRRVRILEKENRQLRETVKEPEIETAIEEQAPALM